MANKGAPFTGLGPFQPFFHSPATGDLPTNLPFDNLMRQFARCQIEMQGLMSRRAQAYLEIPGRLANCRSPQELANEQARFWQTAYQQYTECSQRMMNAWTQALTPVGGTSTAAEPRARDYLTFPEPRQQSAPPASDGQRRVA